MKAMKEWLNVRSMICAPLVNIKKVWVKSDRVQTFSHVILYPLSALKQNNKCLPYPERRGPRASSSAGPCPSEPPPEPGPGRTPLRLSCPTPGHGGRTGAWGLLLTHRTTMVSGGGHTVQGICILLQYNFKTFLIPLKNYKYYHCHCKINNS